MSVTNNCVANSNLKKNCRIEQNELLRNGVWCFEVGIVSNHNSNLLKSRC
jgi:hypothetical protein